MTRPSSRPLISGTVPYAPAALPYGLHLIEPDDIEAAVKALTSGLLAQGPHVAAFERAFAAEVGAEIAVGCSSGTAALHLALVAADVRPGDCCVVPAITFLSTATAVRHCGAEVVFADVDAVTGLITPETLVKCASRAARPIKAILPVHLGGRMCDLVGLARAAADLGALLIEDGCHALGSFAEGQGQVGDCSVSFACAFSFHPVKAIACGEGGMVTFSDRAAGLRASRLRNHGVTRDRSEIVDPGLSLDDAGDMNPWSYEQAELGYNYRMTEVEAALGTSQLRKLSRFKARRSELASRYDVLLAPLAPLVRPVPLDAQEDPCLHLYATHIDFSSLSVSRAVIMRRLLSLGVGTQVHYIPVYRQPYFVERYGPMRLQGAEGYYGSTLTLPLFPGMQLTDVDRVALSLAQAISKA